MAKITCSLTCVTKSCRLRRCKTPKEETVPGLEPNRVITCLPSQANQNGPLPTTTTTGLPASQPAREKTPFYPNRSNNHIWQSSSKTRSVGPLLRTHDPHTESKLVSGGAFQLIHFPVRCGWPDFPNQRRRRRRRRSHKRRRRHNLTFAQKVHSRCRCRCRHRRGTGSVPFGTHFSSQNGS